MREEGQAPGAATTAPPAEKLLPQSEVDRILQDRLARQKEKFADYDDLKNKAARLAEIENAGKSEAEKTAARLAEIEKALGLKDQTIEKLTGELTSTKRQSLAASVASKLGAHDPQDANILSAIASIDPAGENAAGDIEKALTALKESKPYLFKTAGQGTQAPGVAAFNPAGGGQAETDAQRVARLQRQSGARGFGPLG